MYSPSRIVVATLLVAALVAAAPAGTIGTSLVVVDTAGAGGLTDSAVDPATWAAAGYVVVDLQVTVGGNDGDSFTACEATATLTGGGTFWEHPQGSDLPPDPADFTDYGLLRYDSFYTSPEDWPNMGTTGNVSIVAIDNQPTVRWVQWYVNPADPNVEVDGTYTIARYCFLPASPWELCVEGNTYLSQSGGTPYAYHACIPEPSGLTVLALSALLIGRGRR